jgi:hypothetical protein
LDRQLCGAGGAYGKEERKKEERSEKREEGENK